MINDCIILLRHNLTIFYDIFAEYSIYYNKYIDIESEEFNYNNFRTSYNQYALYTLYEILCLYPSAKLEVVLIMPILKFFFNYYI
jgi:hypothetical protein